MMFSMDDEEVRALKNQITEGIKLLWWNGFYDGTPMDGYVLYQGHPHHVSFFDSTYGNSRDLFLLYELTEEEWANVDFWHSEYENHVNPEFYDELSFCYELEMYWKPKEKFDLEHFSGCSIEMTIVSKPPIGCCTYETITGEN